MIGRLPRQCRQQQLRRPISGGKKSKKTGRSLAPVLTRRTLETVSNANTYVRTQAIKHKATELDYTYIGHVYAVSKHGAFANKPQVIPLTGLEGCTGIAVVSEKGYWISHFMEVAMDADQPDHKTMWSHLIKDATNGKAGKYTPPHQLSDIFDAESKPTIYISRPKHNGAKLYTPLINQIMAQIKKGPLANAAEEEFDYKKMMGDQEKNTLGETTARGKMLVEYTNDQQKDSKTQSPQQAMYRVWLEDKDYSKTWPALKTQQGTASNEEAGDKVTKQEYTNHCLVDTSKTIPNENLDDILAAICNKASLDVGSPISAAHQKTQIKIGMSSSQTGCHPSPASKKLPRTQCKRAVTKALESCPNPAGGFLGNKPLTWNAKGLGCVDISVYEE
ncbi:hypothetical protein SLS60_001186 [Paraconiothyrium brasiliense]|uniref:Uncharacterized protein n=1 Tax=Paraconiothyrium brasiliense TaxID=300254 RepID=A0ABR3S8D1_9PLEO